MVGLLVAVGTAADVHAAPPGVGAARPAVRESRRLPAPAAMVLKRPPMLSRSPARELEVTRSKRSSLQRQRGLRLMHHGLQGAWLLRGLSRWCELWLGGDAWHVCLLKVVKAFLVTFKAIDVPTLPTWATNIVNLNDSNDLGRLGLPVCHVSVGETLRQADTLRQVRGVAIVNLDTPRGRRCFIGRGQPSEIIQKVLNPLGHEVAL